MTHHEASLHNTMRHGATGQWNPTQVSYTLEKYVGERDRGAKKERARERERGEKKGWSGEGIQVEGSSKEERERRGRRVVEEVM